MKLITTHHLCLFVKVGLKLISIDNLLEKKKINQFQSNFFFYSWIFLKIIFRLVYLFNDTWVLVEEVKFWNMGWKKETGKFSFLFDTLLLSWKTTNLNFRRISSLSKKCMKNRFYSYTLLTSLRLRSKSKKSWLVSLNAWFECLFIDLTLRRVI